MSCDFTYDHYKRTLREATGRGFAYASFPEFAPDGPGKVILLRHDIDLSLRKALDMARIEAELGVRATYFIRLGSTFYNPFHVEDNPLLREILSLGHFLGLHFDPLVYRNAGLKVADGIRRDMAALSACMDTDVTALSQHRPFSLGLEDGNGEDEELFRHFAYAEPYVKKAKYISDSGKRWREGDLLDNLDRHEKMQVLVHPVWWGGHADWRENLRGVGATASDRVSGKAEHLVERYGAYLKSRD